eukprot:COSAG05_NODE_90_length_20140_cov_25.117060_7_plen_186_part_00
MGGGQAEPVLAPLGGGSAAGDAPKIRRETVLGETASSVVTGSDFTLTCSLTDLSDDSNDDDDPVTMARQLAQARLERLRAVQVVVGGDDEVQTGGLLASVPEGAATGEDVGQSAEGSLLAQMHTDMFARLQRRSLRRQRLAGEHLGGSVASSDDDDESMEDDNSDLWGDWALDEAGDFDYGGDDY